MESLKHNSRHRKSSLLKLLNEEGVKCSRKLKKASRGLIDCKPSELLACEAIVRLLLPYDPSLQADM